MQRSSCTWATSLAALLVIHASSWQSQLPCFHADVRATLSTCMSTCFVLCLRRLLGFVSMLLAGSLSSRRAFMQLCLL
jgi:hypothetical protein